MVATLGDNITAMAELPYTCSSDARSQGEKYRRVKLWDGAPSRV